MKIIIKRSFAPTARLNDSASAGSVPSHQDIPSNSRSFRLGRSQVKKILRIPVLLLMLGTFGYATLFLFGFLSSSSVQVTNVLPNSATVTWVTKSSQDGVALAVKGEEVSKFKIGTENGSVGYDDRDLANAELEYADELSEKAEQAGQIDGSEIKTEVEVKKFGKYKVHHVTFRNLDPSTEYSVMIGQKNMFRLVSGVTFETRGRKDNFDLPLPAYGIVKDDGGQVVKDGVVSMFLEDPEGKVRSNTISTPLSETGSWYIDLNDFYTLDGHRLLERTTEYERQTFAEIVTVQTGSGIYRFKLDPLQDSPAPDMVLEDDKRLEKSKSTIMPDFVFRNLDAKEVDCIGDECTKPVVYVPPVSSSEDLKKCTEGVNLTTNSGGKKCSYKCEGGSWVEKECVYVLGGDPNDPNDPDTGGGTPQSSQNLEEYYRNQNTYVPTTESLPEPHKYHDLPTGSACQDGHCGAVNYNCLTSGTQSDDCWRLCVNGYWTAAQGCYSWSASNPGGNAQEGSTGNKVVEYPTEYDKYICCVDGQGMTFAQPTEFQKQCIAGTKQYGASTGYATPDRCSDAYSGSGSVTEGSMPTAGTVQTDPSINNRCCISINTGFYYKLPSSVTLCAKEGFTNVHGSKSCSEITKEVSKLSPQLITPLELSETIQACDEAVKGGFVSGSEYECNLTKCQTNNCASKFCTTEFHSLGFNYYKCSDSHTTGSVGNNVDVIRDCSVGEYNFVRICDREECKKSCGGRECTGRPYGVGTVSSAIYSATNNLFPSYYVCTPPSDVNHFDSSACEESCHSGDFYTAECKVKNWISWVTVATVPFGANGTMDDPRCQDSKNYQCSKTIFGSIFGNNYIVEQKTAKCHYDWNYNPDLENFRGSNIENLVPTGTVSPVTQAIKNLSLSEKLWQKLDSLKGSKVVAQTPYQPVELVIFDPENRVYTFKEEGTYSINYRDRIYTVRVEEDNEVHQLFVDSNDNGVYDENIDEIILEEPVNLNIIKELASKTFYLQEGYNLISFDLIPSGSADAVNFIKSLNLGAVNSIFSLATYESGSWKSIGVKNGIQYGIDNFQIIPGRGYLIGSTRSIKIVVPGNIVVSSTPVSLRSGWNLVSVHGSQTAYTAKSWLESIDSTSGMDADNITKWNMSKGKYEGFQSNFGSNGSLQEYGFDFPIDSKSAYFVKVVSGDGTWTPN